MDDDDVVIVRFLFRLTSGRSERLNTKSWSWVQKWRMVPLFAITEATSKSFKPKLVDNFNSKNLPTIRASWLDIWFGGWGEKTKHCCCLAIANNILLQTDQANIKINRMEPHQDKDGVELSSAILKQVKSKKVVPVGNSEFFDFFTHLSATNEDDKKGHEEGTKQNFQKDHQDQIAESALNKKSKKRQREKNDVDENVQPNLENPQKPSKKLKAAEDRTKSSSHKEEQEQESFEQTTEDHVMDEIDDQQTDQDSEEKNARTIFVGNLPLSQGIDVLKKVEIFFYFGDKLFSTKSLSPFQKKKKGTKNQI